MQTWTSFMKCYIILAAFKFNDCCEERKRRGNTYMLETNQREGKRGGAVLPQGCSKNLENCNIINREKEDYLIHCKTFECS